MAAVSRVLAWVAAMNGLILIAAAQVQSDSVNIISVMRTDELNRLPDKHIAESLQRLPGVSLERDHGEGSTLAIRGTAPELNSVTLNGALLPSPDGGGRAVMPNALPSPLIRSLVLTKTPTPDQDANSLGGTVAMETFSAFDREGRFLSIETGTTRVPGVSRHSPDAALLWSARYLGGKLGLAAGLSFERSEFGSGTIETGAAWEGDALEEFEHRVYRITRERRGLALNVEFRAPNGSRSYARLVNSRFSDDELRQAHIIEFEEAQLEGALGLAESARELKARLEAQTIRSLVFGTDQRLGGCALSLTAALSDATEDAPLHLSEGTFKAPVLFSNVSFTDSRLPRLVDQAPHNSTDPFALTEIELVRTRFVDRERSLRFDLSRSVHLAGIETELKFGAKTSARVKSNALTNWKLEHFESAPFSLSPALLSLARFSSGAVAYPFGSFGPTIDTASVMAMTRGLDLNAFVDQEKSTVGSFLIREDIEASYLQALFRLGHAQLLAGLRYENTKQRSEGSGSDNGIFAPIRYRTRYAHWLPGLHLRRDLDEHSTFRAAWTSVVVRPSFGQLAPGYLIAGKEAEFGNPGLSPLTSSNVDVGLERTLGSASVLSAYAFHKRIHNFIHPTNLAGSGRWVDFNTAATSANGDKASVSGIELTYTRAFREMPAPWNGFFLLGNATFSTSRATVGGFDAGSGVAFRRGIPLPSQASRVINLTLGYQSESFGARLSVNHTSRRLLEISDRIDSSNDLYVDAQLRVDMNVRYSLTKHLSLVFDALNLNDSPYYVFTGRPAHNEQYETYGRSYRLNLVLRLY